MITVIQATGDHDSLDPLVVVDTELIWLIQEKFNV